MDLSTNAPVRAEARTRIAAPPDLVWEVLSDLEGWVEWNPDVRSMQVGGPVAPGTSFRWKAGRTTIRSTLRAVEPKRLIAWSGHLPGVDAMHVWRLSPDRAGTTVWTGETFSGLWPRLFRRRLQKTLQEALDHGIVALRAECERRVADMAA